MKKILFTALLAFPCIAFAQVRVEADAGVATMLSAARVEHERAKAGARIEAVLPNSTAGALAKLCRGEIAVAGAALGLLGRATYQANMKRVRLVPVEGLPAIPLFVYTSAKALGDAGTRAYLDHLLVNAARLAPQAGLGALVPAAYEQARGRLATKR